MRNGSAAIVPLLLAIVLLFWFIWFLGGANDNLNKTTNLTNLQKIQDKLLEGAVYKRYELLTNNKNIYSEETADLKKALDDKISDDIHIMMQKNKIDD